MSSCQSHSEATHQYTSLKRKQQFGDRYFDLSEYKDCSPETELPYGCFTLLACPTTVCDAHQDPIAHTDAIVITVDGACSNNGRPGARSAYGVFVHRNINNTTTHTRP